MNKYFLYLAAALLIVACTVQTEEPTEEVPITSIFLNRSNALLLVGSILNLKATVEPAEASFKSVTWSTSDDRIATVNSEGELTAVAPGTTIITATTDDGEPATCTITVADIGITATAEASFLTLVISAGSGNVFIDWGDGELTETNNDSSDELVFFHRYSHKSEYIITFTGNNIESLLCDNYSQRDLSNSMLKNYPFHDGYFTALDVSRNPALKSLICVENRISTLDLRNNVLLEYLECWDNRLTNLDVSCNTALKWLECIGNQLTNLDVSSSALLEFLSCQSNRLTALNVSDNTALTFLGCSDNQLTTSALNELFRTLHANFSVYGKKISIGRNPGENDCDVSIAEEKGWNVYYY